MVARAARPRPIVTADPNATGHHVTFLYNLLTVSQTYEVAQLVSNTPFRRLLCDNLLENKQLAVSRRDLWTETFLLLRRIVHKVDYKGVREIMKVGQALRLAGLR